MWNSWERRKQKYQATFCWKSDGFYTHTLWNLNLSLWRLAAFCQQIIYIVWYRPDLNSNPNRLFASSPVSFKTERWVTEGQLPFVLFPYLGIDHLRYSNCWLFDEKRHRESHFASFLFIFLKTAAAWMWRLSTSTQTLRPVFRASGQGSLAGH